MESFFDSQRNVLSTSGRCTPTKDTPYTALMEVQWLFPLLLLTTLSCLKPQGTMKTLMKTVVKAFFVVGKIGTPQCEHMVGMWISYLLGGIFFPC